MAMASSSSPDEVETAEPTAAPSPARGPRAVPSPRSDVDGARAADAADAEDMTRRFMAGDVAALAELYRQTSALVFTIALRTLSSQHDAEDVTQRVFLQAWRSRGTYDPERRPLRAWLVGITRHVVSDKIAERSRQIRLEQRLTEAELVDKGADVGVADRVADAVVVADGLSRLAQPRRQVVEMSFFDGLTHSQISDALGIPLGTVKSHIKRGISQLRRQLGVTDGAS
jgi:RNA polymerase sigma factor (sigma-70 family)